jgi:hypothetical protein
MITLETNAFENLANQVKSVLSPRFHSMLYKNEYIELGRAIDHVYGVHLFFTTKPHMFVMVKSPEQNEYKYLEYTATQFDADSLLTQISYMVFKEFNSLEEEKQYKLIEGIAYSLKKALDSFDQPETKVLQNEVIGDVNFQIAFIHDKYLKLSSKSYIRKFVHNLKHQKSLI